MLSVLLSALAIYGVSLGKGEKIQQACSGPYYENLGCFDIPDDFYHPIYRFLNALPESPEKINTRFYLYTRRNIRDVQEIKARNEETINKSSFSREVPTKFIVHGFMDNRLYGNWEEILKIEFLLHGDYNVIVVDWSDGNSPPYTKAAANARVVGAEIAFLITKLMKLKQLNPLDVHLLGHSLGGHVAGYAGKRIKTIGRITGLDPAGPYFDNMPKTVRLDKSDARFVDLIHTDGPEFLRKIGFGLKNPVGHVDFYPNGGVRQPGCFIGNSLFKVITEGLVQGIRYLVACNHQRAIDLFISSINHRKCEFQSISCPSWEDFKAGRCWHCGKKGEKCAILGLRADEYLPHTSNVSQKLYLETGPSKPFCENSYRVEIKLHQNLVKRKENGKFELYLISGEKTEKVSLKGYHNLHPGSNYAFTLKSTLIPQDIKSITLEWYAKPSILDMINIFRKPKIAVEYIKLETYFGAGPSSKRDSFWYCNGKGVIVPEQRTARFIQKKEC